MERRIEFLTDSIGRHAVFADTAGECFRTAGRGETDEDAIEDLKRNESGE